MKTATAYCGSQPTLSPERLAHFMSKTLECEESEKAGTVRQQKTFFRGFDHRLLQARARTRV
ncbi:hypothetical protein [Desulfovibrio sp. ZJ369]|uniref:hypothetical protein n=1 Tax=Desulfovibrio sp. ZJ369 TaxID=2709793 RepID=UPI0013EDC971|nr:hypothetical protein [Desulfovibrio sp. ZJ369]